jgi:hypothetical protein
MQPSFRIAEIELLEIPVVLRMPFRFGVVTLRQCFQAFVRARIVMADGQSHWGASAEMIVPKWFDKNTQLSDEDNFEQERRVLRMAQAAYLADGSPDTALRATTKPTCAPAPQKTSTHSWPTTAPR